MTLLLVLVGLNIATWIWLGKKAAAETDEAQQNTIGAMPINPGLTELPSRRNGDVAPVRWPTEDT